MDDPNILAAIGGKYLASSAHLLPDPKTAAVDTYESTIEVPFHGLVTITFERRIHRRGRDRFPYWAAIRAVPVESAKADRTKA